MLRSFRYGIAPSVEKSLRIAAAEVRNLEHGQIALLLPKTYGILCLPAERDERLQMGPLHLLVKMSEAEGYRRTRKSKPIEAL